MGGSSQARLRVWWIAGQHSLAFVMLPLAPLAVVAYVMWPGLQWAVLVLAALTTGVVARLLEQRARALLTFERALLPGLNPSAARLAASDLWGRWGIAASVMGLNAFLWVFLALFIVAILVLLILAGEPGLAMAMACAGLALGAPLAGAMATVPDDEWRSVVNGIVSLAKGDDEGLDSALASMHVRLTAAMWPDSPV